MGLAIAHDAREQVVFDEEQIDVPSQYYFNQEKQREYRQDYGEELTII